MLIVTRLGISNVEIVKFAGSPPGDWCSYVTSGITNQNSVSVCAKDFSPQTVNRSNSNMPLKGLNSAFTFITNSQFYN